MSHSERGARYDQIFLTIVQALRYAGIQKYPIDLFALVRPVPNLKTCSYQRLAERNRMTVREVSEMLGSKYGTYICRRSKNQHIIYYNEASENRGLLRFTLAHELAHFYLSHSEKLKMQQLTYRLAEWEANVFARNLLAPIPLAQRILEDPSLNCANINRLMESFHISYQAAQTRLNSFSKDCSVCMSVPAYQEYFQANFSDWPFGRPARSF